MTHETCQMIAAYIVLAAIVAAPGFCSIPYSSHNPLTRWLDSAREALTPDNWSLWFRRLYAIYLPLSGPLRLIVVLTFLLGIGYLNLFRTLGLFFLELFGMPINRFKELWK
jgi:hypothetical protein